MKILITNFYSIFNLGTFHDMLLVKKIFLSSKFFIFSFPAFYKKVEGFNLISPKMKDKDNLLFSVLKFLISIFLKRRQIIKCDCAIDLAGDYLNDVNYSIFHPLLYFFNLLPVIIYKIPFIIFFQSIGPLKFGVNKILAKYLLQKASLIIIRESYSYNYVKKLGINKEKIIFSRTPIIFHRKLKKKKYIGILVDKNLEYFLKEKNIDLMKLYSSIIRVFLNKNEKIMLLPQVIGPEKIPFPLKYINDYSIIKELKNNLKTSKLIVPSIKTPEDLIKNIAKCKFCIVSRFHSLMFILSLRVPFYCISYNKKTEYLLKDLNLNKFCLPIMKPSYNLKF